MFQEFYARSEHLIWPLIGLIIFVAIFVGVLAYVFLGLRDRAKIDRIAAMPLDEESDGVPVEDAGVHSPGRAE